jgi:hypothetical protein
MNGAGQITWRVIAIVPSVPEDGHRSFGSNPYPGDQP